MQVNFVFSNKNNNNNKLLVDDNNYLDKNKLFLNNDNYLYDNKLFIHNNNISNYSGNIKIANNIKILDITFNNMPTLLDFSIIN